MLLPPKEDCCCGDAQAVEVADGSEVMRSISVVPEPCLEAMAWGEGSREWEISGEQEAISRRQSKSVLREGAEGQIRSIPARGSAPTALHLPPTLHAERWLSMPEVGLALHFVCMDDMTAAVAEGKRRVSHHGCLLTAAVATAAAPVLRVRERGSG